MTTKDFFTYIHVHSKPGDWELREESRDGKTFRFIRHSNGQSPICWVGSHMGLNPDSETKDSRVAKLIGLNYLDAIVVAWVSDGEAGFDFRWQNLLKACHLTVPTG